MFSDVLLPFDTPPAATLPTYSPQSLHSSNQNSGKTSTVPTIRISRATRALQWDSSLDREITDPKELLHLDEFLGNQVRMMEGHCMPPAPQHAKGGFPDSRVRFCSNVWCHQVNDLRTRTNHLSATERIFLNATMDFRETIKSMFSLQVGPGEL